MSIKPFDTHYSFESPASVYDEEAMTALELAGRQGAKINEVIEDQNKLRTETEKHMADQQTYIEETRAGVPAEVEAEVQRQIDNGTFDNAIDNYAGGIENRLDTLLGSVPVGSTTMDAEIIDARTGFDDVVYANLGKAIRTQVFRHYRTLTGDVDLNTIIEQDNYVVDGTAVMSNYPEGYAYLPSGLLQVINWGPKGRWITQILRPLTTQCNNIYVRYGGNMDHANANTNNAVGLKMSWGPWQDIGSKVTQNITKDVNINTIIEPNEYVIATTSASGMPAALTGRTGLLQVSSPDNRRWITQILRSDYYSELGFFIRYGHNNTYETLRQNHTKGLDVVWGKWQYIGESSTGGGATNAGQVIVNFGDSITDFKRDGNSVSSFLSEFTGAQTNNVGFGGCRMSLHPDKGYVDYSMCELADAVATGDYSAQEASTYISGRAPERVNTLKSLDFSKVDVVTIAYGTNDFTGRVALDNETRTADKTTFGGALRYSIERLLTAYPNLRIALVCPTWRYWLNEDNSFNYDSDTFVNDNGDKLHDFVDKVIEIAKDYHLPVINPYDEMGINKHNTSLWFATNDGTHPSANGQKILAKLMSKTISGM